MAKADEPDSSGCGTSGTSAPEVLLEGSGRHALYRVSVGVLDDRAVRAFVGGQCHALALALHERTGWPLAWVEDDEGEPKHCFVLDPQRTQHAVDIAGVHRRDELVRRWGACERHVDMSEVLALSGGWGGYREPRVDVAQAFVGAVMELWRSGTELYPPGPDAAAETDEPTPFPACFGIVGRDGREHVLQAGVLDQRARRLLRAEQSYALALYLAHELPGGPWRVGVTEPRGLVRAFAVNESGGIAVDAFGAQPLGKFQDVQLLPIKAIAIKFEQAGYPPADYTVGEHYASLLIPEIATDPEQ